MLEKIVKKTMIISFIAQLLTLFIGIGAQFIKLQPNQIILKQALALENIVQFIEAGGHGIHHKSAVETIKELQEYLF